MFRSLSGCCGSDKTVALPSSRNVAQAFADHLNAVLNRTVSDARLTLLPLPGESSHFTIACLDATRATSFELHRSPLRLLISHTVEVEAEKCHTVSYAYRLMTGEAKGAWVLRWEYFRRLPRPDYPYALAHVHANATLADSSAEALLRKPFPHAHIPTARVPIELVFWHLIAEWDVTPRDEGWQDVLRESLAGYEERRTAP